MCYITATELKNNLCHYMELSKSEDVYVTKNNKVITVLTNPREKAFERFFELKNQIPKKYKNADYDELLKEAILKKCGF